MRYLFGLMLIPTIINSGVYCFKRESFNKILNVSVSVYNPVKSQCDTNPLLTSSGDIIDTNLLKKGKLKWCAISRNLKSKFKFGDTLELIHEGVLSGKYIVKDIMNKRYFNKVDILHYDKKYCETEGKLILKWN